MRTRGSEMTTHTTTATLMFKRLGQCLFIMSLLGISLSVFSATQNMAVLKQSTQQYVLSQIPHSPDDDISVSLSSIDKRIKLAACTQPLTFKRKDAGSTSFKMRLEVHCAAKKSWKLNVTAVIHLFEPVVILKTRKFRNDVIQPEDLEMISKDVSQFQRGYFHHVDDLVGYRLKTSLNKGIVISPSQVIQPWLVKKDQPITISAKNSVLHIRMSGRSLMNARAGDWVRAKNINSGKIVEGTLSAQGELLVGF